MPEKHQLKTNKIFNRFSTFVAKIKQNFEDLNKIRKTTYIIIIIY